VHHAVAATHHEAVVPTHHSPVVHQAHHVTTEVRAPVVHDVSHYDPRYEAPVISHSAYAHEEPGYDYGDEYEHSYSWDDYPYDFADEGADGHEGYRTPVEETHHEASRDWEGDHGSEYSAYVEYRHPITYQDAFGPALEHHGDDWREVHDWDADQYANYGADHEYTGHYATGDHFYQ